MDQISNQVSDQIGSQINDYLQTTTGNIGSDISNYVFQWLVIPSIMFMVIFLAIYIFRTVRRYRVEKAIFEIRDALVHKELKKPTESEPAE